MQVLLQAIKAACDKGKGTHREARRRDPDVKKVTIPNGNGSSAARSRGRRSTRNDPNTSKFYIMQIQSDGSYKVVN